MIDEATARAFERVYGEQGYLSMCTFSKYEKGEILGKLFVAADCDTKFLSHPFRVIGVSTREESEQQRQRLAQLAGVAGRPDYALPWKFYRVVVAD